MRLFLTDGVIITLFMSKHNIHNIHNITYSICSCSCVVVFSSDTTVTFVGWLVGGKGFNVQSDYRCKYPNLCPVPSRHCVDKKLENNIELIFFRGVKNFRKGRRKSEQFLMMTYGGLEMKIYDLFQHLLYVIF